MKIKYGSIIMAAFLSACAAIPVPASTAKTFNDVVFEVDGCVISSDRKAECILVVTSKYRDHTVAIGNGVTLQDNDGVNYSASVRFGKDKWNKILIADSPYQLNFTVENISSKATFIRAIIINRIDIGLGPKQHVGSHSQVIFSSPKMKPYTNPAPTTAMNDVLPKAVSKGENWLTVGYWNYDGVDGQYLPEGMILIDQVGENASKQWKSHLQLKAHNRLPKRDRTLWPVSMSIAERKVCVFVPDYPTYSANVDLPGVENDGSYVFQSCQ